MRGEGVEKKWGVLIKGTEFFEGVTEWSKIGYDGIQV
jgi:hypothetical protein